MTTEMHKYLKLFMEMRLYLICMSSVDLKIYILTWEPWNNPSSGWLATAWNPETVSKVNELIDGDLHGHKDGGGWTAH
jgi:hypothetical protein